MRLSPEQLKQLKIDNPHIRECHAEAVESPQSGLVTFSIPMTPPRELSPNACRFNHWSKASKARDLLRRAVFNEAYNVRPNKPFEYARLTYIFVYRVNRKRDLDNLVASMKAAQDMLVKVGIIQADDWEHLKLGDHMILIDKKRSPLTIIQVKEMRK